MHIQGSAPSFDLALVLWQLVQHCLLFSPVVAGSPKIYHFSDSWYRDAIGFTPSLVVQIVWYAGKLKLTREQVELNVRDVDLWRSLSTKPCRSWGKLTRNSWTDIIGMKPPWTNSSRFDFFLRERSYKEGPETNAAKYSTSSVPTCFKILTLPYLELTSGCDALIRIGLASIGRLRGSRASKVSTEVPLVFILSSADTDFESRI